MTCTHVGMATLNEMDDMTVKGRHNFLIIYFLLVSLVMLKIFAYIFPEARFWGINHLNFLPEYCLYIFIPIALAVLVIPLLKMFRPVSAFLVERFNTYFYDHHEALKIRLLFVFLSGLVFGLCLMPTHFLGDGYFLSCQIPIGISRISAPIAN